MSLLVRSKILGLFVDTLTVVIIGKISHNQFKCNYLRNQKFFFYKFHCISDPYKALNILTKKMGLSICSIINSGR